MRGTLQRDTSCVSIDAVRDTKQSPFRGRAVAEPDGVHNVSTTSRLKRRVP